MGHDHRGSVNGESLMQPTGPAYIFGYQLRIEKYDTWYVVHLYSTNASLSQKGITGKAMQPAALELVQKCKPALTVSNRPRSIYIILQTRSNMYMNQMIEYAHRTFSYYILNIYMDKSQSSSAAWNMSCPHLIDLLQNLLNNIRPPDSDSTMIWWHLRFFVRFSNAIIFLQDCIL